MYWTFNVTAEDVPEPEPEPENEWVCEPPPPAPSVPPPPMVHPLPEPTVPPWPLGEVVAILCVWLGICEVESVVAPVVPLTLTLTDVDTVWF